MNRQKFLQKSANANLPSAVSDSSSVSSSSFPPSLSASSLNVTQINSSQNPSSSPSISPSSSSSNLPETPSVLLPYVSCEGSSKLRINKTNVSFSSAGYAVGRFPLQANIYDLSTPVCLHQDVLELPESISGKLDGRVLHSMEESAPWRLQNLTQNENQKKVNFVSRKEEIDTHNYYILIKTPECSELFPVHAWHTFEMDLTAKAKHAVSTDEAEQHNRIAEAKEAAMNEKIRKRRAEESDDERPTLNVNDPTDRHTHQTSEAFDEDLGLKRQQKKMMRNLVKAKMGTGKTNDYVDSALALTNLRKSEVTWDFENDGQRSDDEEDANDGEGDNENLPNELQQEDDVDGDMDESAPNLTTYGQNVRNLLKKQEEKEQDDELNQYDSGDEEEENENAENEASQSGGASSVTSAAAAKKPAAPAERYVRAAVTSSSSSSTILSASSSSPSSSVSSTAAAGGGGGGGGMVLSKEEMEQKVIRILSLNMGRMNVKDFMASFKVKDKNEEFKLLQSTIQRLCCISTEEQNGQKVKFVNLKPEFRR